MSTISLLLIHFLLGSIGLAIVVYIKLNTYDIINFDREIRRQEFTLRELCLIILLAYIPIINISALLAWSARYLGGITVREHTLIINGPLHDYMQQDVRDIWKNLRKRKVK